MLEELRENGVHVVGRQIGNTGVFENVTRQQCVGQDNNKSFKLVRSEKVSETPSGVPLDVCCKGH